MLVYLILIFFILFTFVILFGAPYLPSFQRDIDKLINLANFKKGDTIVDLGSGDGKVLIALAKNKFHCIGYEINPILWLISFIRLIPYREYASVKLSSFWNADLSKIDGVFVFLIDHMMRRLEKKLESELKKGTVVISYVFKLPSVKPKKITKNSFIYKF